MALRTARGKGAGSSRGHFCGSLWTGRAGHPRAPLTPAPHKSQTLQRSTQTPWGRGSRDPSGFLLGTSGPLGSAPPAGEVGVPGAAQSFSQQGRGGAGDPAPCRRSSRRRTLRRPAARSGTHPPRSSPLLLPTRPTAPGHWPTAPPDRSGVVLLWLRWFPNRKLTLRDTR